MTGEGIILVLVGETTRESTRGLGPGKDLALERERDRGPGREEDLTPASGSGGHDPERRPTNIRNAERGLEVNNDS